MTAIEKIKHDGAVKALKDRLDFLRHKLCQENWGDIRDGYKFKRFVSAMDGACLILAEMRDVWQALKELEPENS